MLAMHGYGMAVGAITGSLTFSSLLGLLLANAFFVLKLADVQWCRFQWNTRTIVVGIVALGLIHSEILPYTVDTELFAIPKPLLVVVFTGCSLPVEKHARRRTTSSRAVAMLQAPSAHFIVYWLGALYTTIHARLRRRFRVTTIGWHDPPAILAV